jgi:hypothetical protein
MDAIRIHFASSASDASSPSKETAETRAKEIARLVHRDPRNFEKLQEEICCKHPDSWLDGQDHTPALARALFNLAVGEIASEPVEDFGSFLVPKRLEPSSLSEPTLSQFELPNREYPDMEFWVSDGRFSEADLRASAEHIDKQLDLNDRARSVFMALHQRLELSHLPAGQARVAEYRRLLEDVEQLLGEERYAKYINLLHKHCADLLLHASAHN